MSSTSQTHDLGATVVTGHRHIEHPKAVTSALVDVFARGGITVAHCGGAAGADSLFANAALAAQVPLQLWLPNRWYRLFYPDSVSDEVVADASAVHMVVDRPDVKDWRQRWSSQRWWVDNFVRNKKMCDAGDSLVVVSPRHPRTLAVEKKGGTVQAVKHWFTSRPSAGCVWVPDTASSVPILVKPDSLLSPK